MPDSKLSSEVKQNMEVWVVSALPQIGEQIPKLILEGSGWLPSDIEGLKLDSTAYAACGMEFLAPSIFAEGRSDARHVGEEIFQVLNRELRNMGNAWQETDIDDLAEERFSGAEDSIFGEIINNERIESIKGDWKSLYRKIHSPPDKKMDVMGITEQYMRSKYLDYRKYLHEDVSRIDNVDEITNWMDNYFVKDISGDLANPAREGTNAPESAFNLEIFKFIIRFGKYSYENL